MKLTLRSHIGQVVYFGPAKEAINYYTTLGFSCRPYVNPADYFMDVVVENERHCAKVLDDGLYLAFGHSSLPIITLYRQLQNKKRALMKSQAIIKTWEKSGLTR